jgi:GNAT superfamily N-acetyltransferase
VIRDFELSDAAAVSAVLHEEDPPHPVTAEGVIHWRDGQPDRAQARMWVWEESGRLVGWAEARIRWTTRVQDVGDVWAYVTPAERGRGIGAALLAETEEYVLVLGARILESWTYTPGGVALLEGRGFRPTGTEQMSVVDPRTVDLSGLQALVNEKAADGFRVVPLGEVLDRVEELHRVYAAASMDVPEYFREDDVRLDEWKLETLEHPQLSPEGSAIVLHGEQPVALAFLEVDEPAGVAANEMTGTLPEFRRRGLARLAKLATIRWAAEHGIGAVQTGNSHENPGILALNRSLGYEPVATETHYVRDEETVQQ